MAVEEHLVFDNAIYPAAISSRFIKTATHLIAQTQMPSQYVVFTPRNVRTMQLLNQGITRSQTKMMPNRIIRRSPDKELSDPLVNAVVSLANETARSGYGALVFCSSRLGCERDALLISQVLPRDEETNECTIERRKDLLNDLRSTSTGLDSMLERTIPVGVAFHREPA